MSTFTKEQLIAAACSRIDFAKQMLRENPLPLAKRKWEIELSLSEIALASLEAEAVAWMWERDGKRDVDMDNPDDGVNRIGAKKAIDAGWKCSPLYIAPPTPVVPEEMPKGLAGQIVSLLAHNIGDKFLAQKIWNACRAAMLQGAENAESPRGNTPVIPDGYCIMPLKLTADNGAKGALCGEFHVQYRIVCQSCVGEGCEDCNHTGGWNAEIPVSWDTIKRIHESAVEACALPAAPQQEVNNG